MFEGLSWVGLGLAHLPLPQPATVDDAGLPAQLACLLQADGAVYAEQLLTVAEMHARHVQPSEDTDTRVIDAWAELEAQIGAVLRIPAGAAYNTISEALALRDRVPCLDKLLRDGTVSKRHAQLVIKRTSLIEDGSDEAHRLNDAVAQIFARSGSWSDHRIRDLVDKAIMIIDASAVRRRRQQAKDDRHVSFSNIENGMTEMLAVVSTDDAAAIRARVEQFAKDVCKHDSGNAAQRRADAVVAAMLGRPALACDCGRDDCTARSRGILAAAQALGGEGVDSSSRQIVVHVVLDQQTLEGRADNPAILEGHGVIDADHARDIAARPEAVVRPVSIPTTDASSPREFARRYLYSPSRSLDDYVRIRDCYCTWPACNLPARYADIDHTIPFDKANPAEGGPTTHTNLKALCRFHHLVKTFTRWTDAQLGNTSIEFTAPDGSTYAGPASCGIDLIPGLTTTHDVDDRPARTRALHRRMTEPIRRPTDRRKPRTDQRSDQKRYARNRNARDALADAESRRVMDEARWGKFVGNRPPPF